MSIAKCKDYNQYEIDDYLHIDFDSLEVPPWFAPKDEDLPCLSFAKVNEQSIDDKTDKITETETKLEEIKGSEQPQGRNTNSSNPVSKDSKDKKVNEVWEIIRLPNYFIWILAFNLSFDSQICLISYLREFDDTCIQKATYFSSFLRGNTQILFARINI